jgi:hypothetical protein
MSEKETYEDRLEFNTGGGLVNAHFMTREGLVPAMLNLELTDVIKGLNELQSIKTVQRDKIKDQLSEHWDRIKDNAVDILQGLNPKDDSLLSDTINAFSKSLELYFEFENEITIILDIIKRIVLRS